MYDAVGLDCVSVLVHNIIKFPIRVSHMWKLLLPKQTIETEVEKI